MGKSVIKLLICVLCFGYCAYAQPKISRDKIPNDTTPVIRQLIEQLYSTDAVKRAEAIRSLAHIEEGNQTAREAVVPFLVDILDDETQLEWKLKDGGYILSGNTQTSPGKEARTALLGFRRDAVAPLIAAIDNPRVGKKAAEILEELTGEMFGQNSQIWKEWWEKNSVNKLKIEQDNEVSYFQMFLFFVVVIVIVVFIAWLQSLRDKAAMRS